MTTSRAPQGKELELWTTYLNDHLTGATGVRDRLRQMVQGYTDLPGHAELEKLLEQIISERTRVQEVIRALGAERSGVKMLAARVGERVGRLKLNRQIAGRSPLSPLLEVELLRSGVLGKLSLWESLALHAERLGLDPQEFRGRVQDARSQLDALQGIHEKWAARAFSEGL